MPEANCHLLGDEMTLEEGVLAEPLSIALYGLKILSGTHPEKIAVLGAGPIGLSVLLAAQASGIWTVYMTDKIEERVDIAQQAGATWAGNPDREDILAAVRGREPGLLDAVFECCGDQSALDQAVALLKPGGELLIIGIPAVDRIAFDVHVLRRKEITLHNVRRQRYLFPEAIALIKNRDVDVRFLVTHEFRLDDAPKAFDLVAGYRDGVIKAIVHNP
jgi:threonine dehydrogenase-like Zn-dependent dehydrogenase